MSDLPDFPREWPRNAASVAGWIVQTVLARDGRPIDYGAQQIADAMGRSRASVNAALSFLDTAGWLRKGDTVVRTGRDRDTGKPWKTSAVQRWVEAPVQRCPKADLDTAGSTVQTPVETTNLDSAVDTAVDTAIDSAQSRVDARAREYLSTSEPQKTPEPTPSQASPSPSSGDGEELTTEQIAAIVERVRAKIAADPNRPSETPEELDAKINAFQAKIAAIPEPEKFVPKHFTAPRWIDNPNEPKPQTPAEALAIYAARCRIAPRAMRISTGLILEAIQYHPQDKHPQWLSVIAFQRFWGDDQSKRIGQFKAFLKQVRDPEIAGDYHTVLLDDVARLGWLEAHAIDREYYPELAAYLDSIGGPTGCAGIGAGELLRRKGAIDREVSAKRTAALRASPAFAAFTERLLYKPESASA